MAIHSDSSRVTSQCLSDTVPCPSDKTFVTAKLITTIFAFDLTAYINRMVP